MVIAEGGGSGYKNIRNPAIHSAFDAAVSRDIEKRSTHKMTCSYLAGCFLRSKL